jgi:starch synthase
MAIKKRNFNTMRILFATSEAAPLIKTGGLADVSGALPAALRRIDIDCRVLLPGYPVVMYKLEATRQIARFDQFLDAAGKPLAARLLQSAMPGSDVPLYVLDAPAVFARNGGPYQDAEGLDYPDNAHRFALLSQVAALLAGPASPIDWRPDLLHCNDWQTGLAPAYLRLSGGTAPSVITVHNLAYQGIFPPSALAKLNLPASSFSIEGVEYYGNLSFLKAGLFYASHITTVSPTYAMEIQQPHLGMGMQGLLAGRRHQLSGILNGIDMDEWNPAADRHLACEFNARATAGKKRCKQLLQEELGLEPLADAPLFGMIARMAHQKGMDLVLAVADGIIDRGGQVALLGTGEKSIEAAVRLLVKRHPGKVAALIGYDEGLSHRIEAGSDIFLMPSLFEPCGLNQMYSLRYGSVPIVHATGGLRDTVADGVTGFVFHHPTAHALWLAIERALDLYPQKGAWKKMMAAGMNSDFSWEKSALTYRDLYEGLLPKAG